MKRKQDDQPRPDRFEGASNMPNRLEDLILRRRAAQHQFQSDRAAQFPNRMDDIVLRQQQLLRQEQFQQHPNNPNNQMMFPSDFGYSQGYSQLHAMPSLREISRADEILAAARDALSASARSVPVTRNQYSGMQDDLGGSAARGMMSPSETQWASYGHASLRAGQQNAAISSSLANQDMSHLHFKQNQARSLATAAHPSQSQMNYGTASHMGMRQTQQGGFMNQVQHDNMGLLESLLLRQEEERLLMKRQRPSSFDEASSRPSKIWPSSAAGLHMEPHPLPAFIMADKNQAFPPHMQPQGDRPPHPKQRKRRAKTFPVKLMETIIDHYDEGVVAWLPDGKSFVVVDPDLFVERMLTKTFKDCKYASFVRKLNRWGFARLTSGTGTDCFHHPLFQRDRMDLCARMLCTPRNDGKKTARKPKESPNRNVAVDPSDRPSLAGVEKFFSPKGKSPGKSEEDDAIDDAAARGDEDDL